MMWKLSFWAKVDLFSIQYRNLYIIMLCAYANIHLFCTPTPLAVGLLLITKHFSDPYHGAGQAHGLAFSVQKGVAIPPSLRNIYKYFASSLYADNAFQYILL